jgi:DNA-binding CsgD family transcriptional regulator
MSSNLLNIRLATNNCGTVHVLLLRNQDPCEELRKLGYLGLGKRATEVLYWLAKTNEEIGIILGITAGTVKDHLKKIFHVLKIENRSTAASIISEILASP